ncbi:MAG TPA: hypothetical protein PK811_06670 [bacterium]|nr:hypothetical protein [bacterium]
MEGLKTSTFVDRVWYVRIKENKEKIASILLDHLIRYASIHEIDVDISTFRIEERYVKKRGCEDRLEVIGIIDILNNLNEENF